MKDLRESYTRYNNNLNNQGYNGLYNPDINRNTPNYMYYQKRMMRQFVGQNCFDYHHNRYLINNIPFVVPTRPIIIKRNQKPGIII